MKDEKLVLFVGSGASIAAGAPTWSGLLTELLDECGRQNIEVSEEAELARLIQGPPDDLIIAAGYLRKVMRDKMDEYLGARFAPGRLHPQAVHEAITSLPIAGVVTTNYDSLIEDQFAPHSLDTVLPDNPHKAARVDRDFVLKLHGTWAEPHDIVIGPGDYNRVVGDESLQATLARLFQQYTVLFVGFGLADPDALTVLSRLRAAFEGQGRRHYALLDGARVGRIRCDYFIEQLQVQVVRYEPTALDHPEVAEFLVSLSEASGHTLAMSKTLLIVKAVTVFGTGAGEPRLLVTRSNKQWAYNGEPAYMLPSLTTDPDQADFHATVANYFGVSAAHIALDIDADPLESGKDNPALGDKLVDYRFRYVKVKFESPDEDLETRLTRIGGKTFEWHTLNALRSHDATMKLNDDVMVDISRRYGSTLEELPVALELNEIEDPYNPRATSYTALPWVKSKAVFDRVLDQRLLDEAAGVLDLGCGTGVLARALRDRSRLPYVGFDVSAAMLAQAEKAIAGLRNVEVSRFDIAGDVVPGKFDNWLFVMKNVLHLLPRVLTTLATVVARFGRPSALVLVETESPSPLSLMWVQGLFEVMGPTYKRNWFSDGQVRMAAELVGLRVDLDDVVDQRINVDRWIASFDLPDDQQAALEDRIVAAPEQVREEMKLVLEPGKRKMLRRQRILHVSAGRRSA